MDKTLKILFFVGTISLADNEISVPKKRVCVIGAGPSGILTVKQLTDNIDEFKPIVFEKNSDVGGNWIYTDNDNVDEHGLPVHSSVYKYMRANSVKEMMVSPDYPSIGRENRSCVKHETILEYLRNYTNYYNLRPHIQFNTLVEKVTPVVVDNDKKNAKWRVQTRDLNSENLRDVTICDSVIVCNGVFNKPSIPSIPGIEYFSGRVLHSHSYRKPEYFANQTVVIFGAFLSGPDIAVEVSEYAKKIYLSHRHDKIQGEAPQNIIQVASIVKVNRNEFILQDGSKIMADSLILCTGYGHEVSFLDATSGLQINDKHIFPLYKQIINVNYPTMGFVGILPAMRVFCQKFYLQAKYYVAYFQGKVKLPTRKEMLEDATELLPENLKYNLTVDWWWDFLDKLAADTKSDPLPNLFRKGYPLWLDLVLHNRFLFKDYDFHILGDERFEIVKSLK